MDQFESLDQFATVEELVGRREALVNERQALDSEWGVKPMPGDVLARFQSLTEEVDEIDRRVDQKEARMRVISEASQRSQSVERIEMPQVQVKRTARDIWDISEVRASVTDPFGATQELRDRAMTAIESSAFSHIPDRSTGQTKAEYLLRQDDENAVIARHILVTGSPTYNRAFAKTLKGLPLDAAETNAMGMARALSLSGTAGGHAVPFDLDPTIIPTSNGVVNPVRQVANVKQTTVDTWRGVSSGAITATYEAEATETTDNTPTLAQPEISTEKAQAFIPFSIEIGMDWGGLRGEMGTLLQESKDTLEASKFLSGSGTNEPFGVLTGTTNTVNAAAGADGFTLANLYSLIGALPPRHRPGAVFMGDLAILNRIRQFDTVGSSAAIWADSLQDDLPGRLLGRPAYEASEMPNDATTGNKFLLFGNFSRYVIVDRVGLTIELIPHLFGSNQRPTGQRGLYAFWRNGAKVVDAGAFRALLGTA